MPRKYEEVVNDYLVRKFFEEQQEYAQLYGEQSIKPLPEDLRVEEHEFHESSSHQIGDYTWDYQDAGIDVVFSCTNQPIGIGARLNQKTGRYQFKWSLTIEFDVMVRELVEFE